MRTLVLHQATTWSRRREERLSEGDHLLANAEVLVTRGSRRIVADHECRGAKRSAGAAVGEVLLERRTGRRKP